MRTCCSFEQSTSTAGLKNLYEPVSNRRGMSTTCKALRLENGNRCRTCSSSSAAQHALTSVKVPLSQCQKICMIRLANTGRWVALLSFLRAAGSEKTCCPNAFLSISPVRLLRRVSQQSVWPQRASHSHHSLGECCCQTPSPCGGSPSGPAHNEACSGSSKADCGCERHDVTFLATSCAISSQSTTETLCCRSIVTTALLPQAMPPVTPTSNMMQSSATPYDQPTCCLSAGPLNACSRTLHHLRQAFQKFKLSSPLLTGCPEARVVRLI